VIARIYIFARKISFLNTVKFVHWRSL